jgi:hypothetical protein
LKDVVGWSLFQFARPFLNFYTPRREWLPRVRDLLDNYGVSIVPHHYYEPVYTSADLIRDPSAPRALDGIDWNDEGQLKLLGDFRFADDLRQLEGRPSAETCSGTIMARSKRGTQRRSIV